METTDYQKQATDFLTKTNTKMYFSYLKHDKHFFDDKNSRDIWKVTIKRDSKRFSFNFGQSIVNTGKQPTEYDVLSCLEKYDVGSFEDFCSEFGYDTDSRNAEKTYKAVVKEYDNVCKIWTNEEIEELQEIA